MHFISNFKEVVYRGSSYQTFLISSREKREECLSALSKSIEMNGRIQKVSLCVLGAAVLLGVASVAASVGSMVAPVVVMIGAAWVGIVGGTTAWVAAAIDATWEGEKQKILTLVHSALLGYESGRSRKDAAQEIAGIFEKHHITVRLSFRPLKGQEPACEISQVVPSPFATSVHDNFSEQGVSGTKSNFLEKE